MIKKKINKTIFIHTFHGPSFETESCYVAQAGVEMEDQAHFSVLG